MALVVLLAAVVGIFVAIDRGVDAVADWAGVERVHCGTGADVTCAARRLKAWLAPLAGEG